MHWIDQARHLARRRCADHHAGQPELRRSRASATSAPTSDRPWWPTRWSASISPRTGSASIPKADYDKTLAAIKEVVAGYPGLFRDVQTYLKERIKEVLTGAAVDRRAHLRPRLEVLRGKARGGPDGAHDDRRDRRPARRAPGRHPPGGGRGRSRQGRSSWASSRATSAARPPRSCLAKKVGDIYRAGKAYDVMVWGRPRHARA